MKSLLASFCRRGLVLLIAWLSITGALAEQAVLASPRAIVWLLASRALLALLGGCAPYIFRPERTPMDHRA